MGILDSFREMDYISNWCVRRRILSGFIKRSGSGLQRQCYGGFFQFKGNDTAADDIYLNFEMNANGALLACYGKNKMNRIPFTPDQIRKMKCSAEIREEQWNVNLTLPIEILEQIYGKLNLQEGSDFRCNFYKICETKEYEHYAAYRCVESERPNFHLPEYFEKAVILKRK
ncbi:MAG: carbohydrate-binding family 9-like protein [Dorea longicatena]